LTILYYIDKNFPLILEGSNFYIETEKSACVTDMLFTFFAKRDGEKEIKRDNNKDQYTVLYMI
jgi:hypothetical protein